MIACGALLFAMIVSTSNLDAKSSGGGSRSFSSSSSRSFSSSSSRPSSSWRSSSSKSSNSTSKYNGFGSSSSSSSKSWSTTPQTSARVGSKVEVSRYQSAVKSGKAFTTRETAVSDFKSKYANTYTSKYTSEPAKRPSHIPNVYRSGGNTYNVTYDRNYGGYGYWSGGGPGLGTFMLYDAMSDMVMMNTLMSKNNYYVGPPVQESMLAKVAKGIMWVFIALGVSVLFVYAFIRFNS